MSEQHFETPALLDRALADSISEQLQTAIAARGEATLVVSGGSTPKGLFAELTNRALDWSKVTILLADERWVAMEHNDRNEAMLRERLLSGHASAATLLSLAALYPDVEGNLAQLRAQLDALPSFDVVVLGMGGDSHTASLFPCSAEIQEGLSTHEAALMTNPTTAPHARVSLSRQRLANTRCGIVHIVGADKLAVIEKARGAQASTAPIAAFLTPETDFTVWYAPKD